MGCVEIPRQTLLRLPTYLHLLKQMPQSQGANISATAIAEHLSLNQVQVRKDLSMISDGGKPKTGYRISELIADLEHFLGYDNIDSAILVGIGNLGHALLNFDGFADYGLEILAGFDQNCSPDRERIAGKLILPMEELPGFCRRTSVHIGILTVPAVCAQEVCDILVDAKIRAIWNFTPVHLEVPKGILVQDENMAASLALLSQHLKEQWNRRDL